LVTSTYPFGKMRNRSVTGISQRGIRTSAKVRVFVHGVTDA
jgi:hypothetical protein